MKEHRTDEPQTFTPMTIDFTQNLPEVDDTPEFQHTMEAAAARLLFLDALREERFFNE